MLLLDEPTSELDLRRQPQVLSDLRDEIRAGNRIVVVALHDLTFAGHSADRLILLREGELIASGPPEQVLGSPEVAATYGVNIELHRGAGGLLQVIAGF